MLLVLDVDETLIHSQRSPIPGAFRTSGYYVRKRPYLDEFIDNIMNDPEFKVGVWSAGIYDYVWDIVEEIFPDVGSLQFVMTRDDCVPVLRDGDQDFFKPLTFTEYDNTLLIDNKHDVTTDSLQQIIIKDFYSDKGDIELARLWNYLNDNRGMSPEWLSVNWY